MSTNDFTDRMRSRMPSHSVWRETEETPGMSRPADDALWNEMRGRLRDYQVHKISAEQDGLRLSIDIVKYGAAAGAIGIGALGASLLMFALMDRMR